MCVCSWEFFTLFSFSTLPSLLLLLLLLVLPSFSHPHIYSADDVHKNGKFPLFERGEREQNEEERKEKISQIREEILSILEKLNERVKI